MKDASENTHIDRIIRRQNKLESTRLMLKSTKSVLTLLEKEGVALSVVLDHQLNNAISILGPKGMRYMEYRGTPSNT